MIVKQIDKLVSYGIKTGLIEPCDSVYVTNRILEKLKISSYEPTGEECNDISELDDILNGILDYAAEHGLLENDSVVYRDLFDTEIMDILTPRPSYVIHKFNNLCRDDIKSATDYFYKLSGDSNYIRRGRIKKDIKWKVSSEYGDIDISINCSKPEKDPKAIAAAKNMMSSAYPKCQLCIENEGYAGRVNHPARANHRIIPIDILGESWGFQYSPYVYYNEHCIVFNRAHQPMVIDKGAFAKLLDFVGKFEHYIIGSNADLPIVGGSILSHEHFQGGNYDFAMLRAEADKEYSIEGFSDIKVERVKWPMSVIRISGKSPERLVELADRILTSWRGYSDEAAFIFAETDGTPHNTITPIAHRVGDAYALDLVLRNNITTEEHPLGVYHPHAELHHIKKENIGLIEVMGLAILPARLVGELSAVADALVSGKSMTDDATISHREWAEDVLLRHPELTADNALDIVYAEVGKAFVQVLEHAGVYKRDAEGLAAFDRFIDSI